MDVDFMIALLVGFRRGSEDRAACQCGLLSQPVTLNNRVDRCVTIWLGKQGERMRYVPVMLVLTGAVFAGETGDGDGVLPLSEEKTKPPASSAEARYQAIRDNPKQIRAAFGATFCAMKNLRASSLAEIAKERRYGALGMVNKVKLYSLQQRIRFADEAIERTRKALKTYRRLTIPGCTDPVVETLLFCRNSGGEACEVQLIQDMLKFIPDDPEIEDGE